MSRWIEQTFFYRYVALANSNDDEMIAPRILFCDYLICTKSTSELLATHIASPRRGSVTAITSYTKEFNYEFLKMVY